MTNRLTLRFANFAHGQLAQFARLPSRLTEASTCKRHCLDAFYRRTGEGEIEATRQAAERWQHASKMSGSLANGPSWPEAVGGI